jgi:hypothetical protein
MKAILIVVLIFISITAKSQLYALFQPQWGVFGLLYNYSINKSGVMVRAQYGGIKSDGVNIGYYKTGIGYSYGNEAKFMICLNYNRFSKVVISDKINLSRIKPISFDMGMSVTSGRITFMALTDILNWETTFGVNYKFKRDKKHEYTKSTINSCLGNHW